MLLGQAQTFASPTEALDHISEQNALESLRQADHRSKPGTPGDILKHHGIKGQKWGVRKEEDTNGQVSGKVQSQASTKSSIPALSEKKQRKVDKFMQRSDVMSAQIADLKRQNEALGGNPAQRYQQYANNQTIKQLDKSQRRALRDAEAVKKGKLTSTQKKLIIGGVVVTGVVAYVAISKGQQSGALNSWKLLGEARLRGQQVPFNVNKELSKSMSASELLSKVAKPVNPGYAKAGGKMNCRRSTYAYELRRRGFDVHATTSAVGWGQSESGVINAVTPGGRNFYRALSMSQTVVETGKSGVASGDRRINPVKKIFLDGLDTYERPKLGPRGTITGGNISSSKRVLEELAKQPNGSRGEVLFKFPGFGHSMAYEVVDGVPHIFDSQKGTLYNSATKMVESKWDGFHGAEITRLDNVDLDLNFLTRWATNVGGK